MVKSIQTKTYGLIIICVALFWCNGEIDYYQIMRLRSSSMALSSLVIEIYTEVYANSCILWCIFQLKSPHFRGYSDGKAIVFYIRKWELPVKVCQTAACQIIEIRLCCKYARYIHKSTLFFSHSTPLCLYMFLKSFCSAIVRLHCKMFSFQ